MDGPKRQALIQKPDSQQLDEPENNVIGMAISPPIYVEAKKKCWLRRVYYQINYSLLITRFFKLNLFNLLRGFLIINCL